MKDKVMPALVLTVICVIAAVLLTFAHEMTKDRIAEQKDLKFSKSVELLFGKTESRVVDLKCGIDEVETIAVTPDKKTAIQICTDGYSKDGINILVGIQQKHALHLICRIQLENFTRHFFNHFHTITREAERFHHLVYRCQLCSILLRPFSSTVLLLLPGAPTAIQSTSCLPDTAFFLHHR